MRWESGKGWGRYVPSSGPLNARVMLVGEAPGKEEDREGEGFVGKSGQILFQYVWRQMGMSRDECFVTNLSKERPEPKPDGTDNPPSPELIAKYGPELVDEIVEIQPDLIVCLGKYSFQFLTKIDLPMETVHGKLYQTVNFVGLTDPIPVIPAFHPASGIRNPDYLKFTFWDLGQAGRYLRGEEMGVAVEMPGVYTKLEPWHDPRWGKEKIIAIDTEGIPDAPFCLTYSNKHGEAWMIPAWDKEALNLFKMDLEKARPLVVMHNSLWDWPVLKAMGIDLLEMGLEFRDTMEMAYLLQTEPKGLKALAARHFAARMREYEEVCYPHVNAARRRWFEDVYLSLVNEGWDHDKVDHLTKTGKKRKKALVKACKCEPCKTREKIAKWLDKPTTDFGDAFKKLKAMPAGLWNSDFPDMSLSYVPEAEVLAYACADADYTFRLFHVLAPMVEEMQLGRAEEMDLAVWPLVDRIRETGMLVDLDRVAELDKELTQNLAFLDDAIRVVAEDDDLNPGSAAQVAEVLFRKRGLQSVKLTKGKTRESVADDVIQSLLKDYPDDPLLPLYAERVEVAKLKSSYIDNLPSMLEADGRVHPRLGTTSVVSGRFNHFMLTFPQRSEIGKRIRDCFVAPPGYVLGSWDLSQIELRVSAHLTEDENFIEAFIKGEDLHTKTAQLMFKLDKPSKEQRYVAKTLNFAILYGISADGLYAQFKIAKLPYTLADCEGFVSGWFAAYPRVKPYMQKVWAETRREGYVREGLSGRIRYLPGVFLEGAQWPFSNLRSGAERESFSLKVQGFARTLMKEAEARVWTEVLPALWEQGWDVQPVLDIHDEILLQVPDHATAKAMTNVLMLETMTQARLKVPVAAEGGYGRTWGSLK